jgi:ATP-dependent RNA helicase DeaD
MEVLNNVQLEGRRINVEISKMMVAEDVITTEEVLVVFGGRSSAPRREGSFAPRREGSGGGRSDRNSGPREGGFGGRSSAPREGGFMEEVQLKR